MTVPAHPLPAPGQVDIWVAEAGPVAARRDLVAALLDGPEHAQAARYRVEHARQLFEASRVLQRVLAAGYAAGPAAAVAITRRCEHCDDPDHGRPRLVGSDPPLDYSVAHSGELVLLGYVGEGRIGVDVEILNRRVEVVGLADRVCTAAERDALTAAPDATRTAVFHRYWTRKEAVVKLTGRGLAAGLAEIDVSGTRSTGPDGAAGRWLTDLTAPGLPPGYLGAVATSSRPRQVVVRPVPPEILTVPVSGPVRPSLDD